MIQTKRLKNLVLTFLFGELMLLILSIIFATLHALNNQVWRRGFEWWLFKAWFLTGFKGTFITGTFIVGLIVMAKFFMEERK